MTRVDFYVVSSAGPDARLEVAVRLADKAWARGHRLFIHTADEAEARRLSQLLWTFRPASFLPHGLACASGGEAIQIGWGQEPEGHDDVLINLTIGAPPFFSRFERVAEIVTQDPQFLEALRNSWRFYKDRGYPLHKHDL